MSLNLWVIFNSHLVKTGLEDDLMSLNLYKIKVLKTGNKIKKILSLSTVPQVPSKCCSFVKVGFAPEKRTLPPPPCSACFYCNFIVDPQKWKQGTEPRLLCVVPVSFPQETQQIPTEDVALDICLSNGQKISVNILTSDQTEDVLDVRAHKHVFLQLQNHRQPVGL